MFNIPAAQVLLASVIAGIIGISSFLVGSTVIEAPVTVSLKPTSGVRTVGETLVVTLEITSSIPVNVFKGFVTFDSEKLSVRSIDYNASIANLWAEEPWYSNGDGTINFTGGTTVSGGFVGEGTLITITFETSGAGDVSIQLQDMRVLQHDGLGSEAQINKPIDSIFSIAPAVLEDETIFKATIEGPHVVVIPEMKNRDINNDGKQSMADVSIFMTDLVSQNSRSDFDGDGKVSLKDLSILTN